MAKLEPTSVLCFHGNSHVSFGTDPTYKLQKGFTLEAWVNITRAIPWAGVISRLFHTGNVQSGYAMLLDGGTGLHFALKPTNGDIVYLSSGPNVLSAGNWNHIAMTWDGMAMHIHVNGWLVARRNIAADGIDYDPDNDLALGHLHDSNEDDRFVGKLAEVRIWSRPRSEAEIISTMHDRIVGPRPGLVSCWPLNEGSGDTVRDATGEAPPAKAINATWETSTLPPAGLPREPSPTPLVQSGTYSSWYGKEEWPLVQGTGARTFTTLVPFPQPFDRVPDVAVGVSMVDILGGHNTRLKVYAEGITREGFTLVFQTWADTQVWGCGASWVASVDGPAPGAAAGA